jgi:hypothetical protein
MSHQDGMSLRQFADYTGLREALLRDYCRTGKIIGARKHPLTKKWWIYPPALLATGWSKSPVVKGGV